jgi:TIR domain
MTAKRVSKAAAPRAPAKPAGRARRVPTIFISYRHEPPTTAISRKLFTALVPAADVWNADVFMDDHDLEPADLFDQKILAALDRTTHFIVLLTNAYWSSEYCRKELARVVTRFEADRSVRLLFVKVEELDPNHFAFTKDRTAGRIVSGHPVIDRIGDVQFLGPFNDQLQLVRLEWEHPARLGDQIAQLISRLGRVIDR